MISRSSASPPSLRHNRRGAILLLIAVSTVALMGMLVMALDAGLIQRVKRLAQTAADAAAQAGAIEIFRERTDSVDSSALSEARRNGYDHGVDGKAVFVSYPNTTGTHTGPNYVGVVVHDTVRTLFGGFLKRSIVVVHARAVGGVTGTTQACITSLDPNDEHSLIVESGAIVNTLGCDVAVNSSDPDALCVTASEGGTLNAGTGSISVTGGYDSGCGGTVSPSPTTGAPPIADPLAWVHLEVSDTLTSSNPCRGGVYELYKPANGTLLTGGTYCGGIKVASDDTVYFDPGVYVIKGGGFEVSGGGAVLGGTIIGTVGVTIINLNAPAANGGAARFDVIDFGSDAIVNLIAPTTGQWAGILFYTPTGQGPVGAVQQNQITSDADATLGGSLYFPDQELRLGSGGTLTINGGVVAGVIQFRSDARVNVAGFAGGTPYAEKRASVVE